MQKIRGGRYRFRRVTGLEPPFSSPRSLCSRAENIWNIACHLWVRRTPRESRLMLLSRTKWMYLAIVPVIAAAVPGAAWLTGERDRDPVDPPTLRLLADLSDKRLKMY